MDKSISIRYVVYDKERYKPPGFTRAYGFCSSSPWVFLILFCVDMFDMFWKVHLRLCFAVYSLFFCFYLLCKKHSWPRPVYSPSCVPEICSRARCQIDEVCEESLGLSASVYKDLVMTQIKILVQKVVYIFFARERSDR